MCTALKLELAETILVETLGCLQQELSDRLSPLIMVLLLEMLCPGMETAEAGMRIHLGASDLSNWQLVCCPHHGQVFAFISY